MNVLSYLDAHGLLQYPGFICYEWQKCEKVEWMHVYYVGNNLWNDKADTLIDMVNYKWLKETVNNFSGQMMQNEEK
jgi:hypothetical protein